jgi:putative ABC transport system substrate-binding protein
MVIVWSLLSHRVLIAAPPSLYRIGVLTPGPGFNDAVAGLREGLAQLGYTEGSNLVFLLEDAQGDTRRLNHLITRLLAAGPDLICTFGSNTTMTAKQATTTLPIVFTFVAHPRRVGLIPSQASSQNNLTGIANHAGTLIGKRLELLKMALPSAKRVLTLVVPRESVSVMAQEEVAAIAPKLGVELVRRDVSTREDLMRVLDTLPTDGVDAMLYIPSSLVGSSMELLSQKAKELKLPLIGQNTSAVERGALLSYGADFRRLGHQAARLVFKILSGAKPSEIPIQSPEQLLLAVNLHTARTIGLPIPRDVLELTDLLVE